jgi:predicted phage-related endonuclease
VPALIGGRGFQMYHAPRNEEVIKHICDKATTFWEQHIVKQIPPADVAPSLELVKRIQRVPEKVVDVAPELVQAWLDAKEAVKVYDNAKEEAQAKLLAAIGDAEAGNAGYLGQVTYLNQTRGEYVSKASTFRVLRHKKVKKG